VCAAFTQCSLKVDCVGHGNEVEHFAEWMSTIVSREAGDNHVFVVLFHHEHDGRLEIRKELCLVDGYRVVRYRVDQQQVVGLDSRKGFTVVRLYEIALHARIVRVVDDQTAHADALHPLDAPNQLRRFARVHRT